MTAAREAVATKERDRAVVVHHVHGLDALYVIRPFQQAGRARSRGGSRRAGPAARTAGADSTVRRTFKVVDQGPTMVQSAPWVASSNAVSTPGIRWPRLLSGANTKCAVAFVPPAPSSVSPRLWIIASCPRLLILMALPIQANLLAKGQGRVVDFFLAFACFGLPVVAQSGGGCLRAATRGACRGGSVRAAARGCAAAVCRRTAVAF
jgi:hypothetical protein